MSADILLGVPGRLKQILDRLTAGRASNLDRVDATVSSRATQTSVNSVNNAVGTVNSRLTAARAANLDNIAGAPKCLCLNAGKALKGNNYTVSLGYTVKDPTKVAIFPQIWIEGNVSYTNVVRFPGSVKINSTNNGVVVASPASTQNLYFYGTITVIDYNP
jgi:hypothetical protein